MGVTTEVCVNTTMREANDRGFECVLVTDATASYVPKFKEWAIEFITSFNGIVGWAAESGEVIGAIEASASDEMEGRVGAINEDNA